MKMDWGDSLRRLYSTREDRMDLADDLLEAVKEIERGEVDKRRNLKIWLIEGLLDDSDSDFGFLKIWMINHLRFDFRREPYKGKSRALDFLIEEWHAQSVGRLYHDTLYYVLCTRGESHAKRRAALLMQCRRVRSGSFKQQRLARVSQRILESAKPPEKSDEGDTELLGSVPSNKWELAWKLQELMCYSRFSDMGHILDLAKVLEDEVEDARPELKKYDHRPDLSLKWWICQVRQRVASWCMEGKEFEKTRIMMNEIAEEAQECAPSPGGYLEQIRRASEPQKTSVEHQSPASVARVKVVGEFLDSWLDFRRNEKGALKIREYPRRKGKGQLDEVEDVKVRVSIRKFKDSLQRFNQHIHGIQEHSPTNRPTFLKHTLSVNSDQQRIRSVKLLGEISHARQAVHLYDSNLSCLMLEILHRLLIYRLWWESYNYKGSEPCFELEHVKGIVRDIKTDLEKIYPDSVAYRNKLVVSFRPTEDMLEKMDPEDWHYPLIGHARINELLRERIDSFHKSGEGYWNETHGESHILGIPIMPSGESPYDVLNPLRSYVGSIRPRDDTERSI